MNDFAVNVLTAKGPAVFSVGQAGFIVKSERGELLGVDLYLSECVERIEGNIGFKRLLPKILDPFELQFDCLIATHPHYDHFDTDAIPQLMSNGKTRLFASVNCSHEVLRLKMPEENCTYVKPSDSFRCGGFNLDFINCDHGTGAPDAVGVIITVDGKRIVMAGDTALRLDRKQEYSKKGCIDLLIAPINGAYGNLNEGECAVLAHTLGASLTVPCHYGMFASHGGNPGKFRDIMERKYSENKYLIMAMGEKLSL